MRLRQATEQDVSVISRIHAASWRTAYRGMVPQSYLDRLDDRHWEQPFTVWLREGTIQATIAFSGDTPVGCVSYGKPIGVSASDVEDAAPEEYGYLLSLYVLPGEVGKGYGKALLHAAERALKQQGYTHCFLYVLDQNTNARRFYEHCGYAWDGGELPCVLDGVQLNDLRYVKPLL